MGDYHTTYKGPEGQTTQWDDIQIKLGNMAPKAPKHKPPKWEGEQEAPKNAAWLKQQDEEQLSEHEDAFEDDREMEQLRQQRLRELKEASTRPVGGALEFIRSSEFKEKVTTASEQCWVVVLLFKHDHEGCAILSDCFTQLSQRHPRTRFVKIVSTDCIPDFPDAKLPTVLLYHEGKCCKSFAGLTLWGGKRAAPEYVALVLNQEGDICKGPGEGEGGGAPEERELRDLVKRVVLQRQADVDDEDSDFDD